MGEAHPNAWTEDKLYREKLNSFYGIAQRTTQGISLHKIITPYLISAHPEDGVQCLQTMCLGIIPARYPRAHLKACWTGVHLHWGRNSTGESTLMGKPIFHFHSDVKYCGRFYDSFLNIKNTTSSTIEQCKYDTWHLWIFWQMKQGGLLGIWGLIYCSSFYGADIPVNAAFLFGSLIGLLLLIFFSVF